MASNFVNISRKRPLFAVNALLSRAISINQNYNIEPVRDGGLLYKMVKTERDANNVLDLYFDVYVNDEPSLKSNNADGKAIRNEESEKFVLNSLCQGTSFITFDDRKSGGDMIPVGFLESLTFQRTDEVVDMNKKLEKLPKVLFDTMVNLAGAVLSPKLIFDSYPKVNKLYHLGAGAVLPDYRNRGILTNLITHNINMAERADCDMVSVIITSSYSDRICQKIGMKILNEIPYSAVTEPDGKPCFKDVEFNILKGYVLKL